MKMAKKVVKSVVKEDVLAKFERYPLVHVKWRDAADAGGNGWVTTETMTIPLLAGEAAGFLIHDGLNQYGEDCIGLAGAMELNAEGKPNFCVSFIIPRQMVMSMRIIENE